MTSSWPLVDPRAELSVRADAPNQLEIHVEPGRVELDDLADDGLETFVDPELRHACCVLHCELDEELLLRAEVVEDRATGATRGLLQLYDCRAFVAMLGETARFYERERWVEDGTSRESPLGPVELRYNRVL